MVRTILVVDDDVEIGNMLQELFAREGYTVLRAYSGTEALLMLDGRRPDLVLLDLMLPGLSGEDILPKLRGIPAIVLSAKADISDKVRLLRDGAADYMTKPFDTKELLARIEVQLRNAGAGQGGVYEHGDLALDTVSHFVSAGGQPVALTKTEYALLKLLMQNPGRVLAKSSMLELISLDTPDCTESSLKTHMSHLRAKLRAAGGREYIESVWGIGFKLAGD